MTSRKRSQSNKKQPYRSFIDFMEDMVMPAKEKNPDHIRLDGRLEGSTGNTATFGRFIHLGCVWEVNCDTYYFPLQLAYNAAVEA